ncbi:MAG: 2-isopropylmalate synthase [Synergistaceae bacterium]|nr:2-isopropylmalate synthase [Synergistaceae bacterium]
MNKVKIFDTTLRDGEQSPGCSMNLSEKIVMARQLEKLGVDIIEAGFAIASPMDFKSIQAIAQSAPNCIIASLARCNKLDIDTAWDAVKDAKKPRIHVFIATSDVHMKFKLRMSPEQVLQTITDMVSYAKSKCDDIEFSAEDASRSDREFLAKSFSNAIAAGATTINVPDTVGYSTPQEMADLISYLRENVIGIENVDISVHCHNDLGMGVANSLACVKAGATQVECTVNGIGERAGNASMEEIVMALRTRKDFYQADTNINTLEIYKSSRLLSNITGVPIAPTKPIVGANAFAHEAGIHQHGIITNAQTYEIMNPDEIGIPHRALVLGKHSGKHALRERLEAMGYEIPDEELEDIFVRFKKLADAKKVITSSDLEALTLHRSKITKTESENNVPLCQLVSHSITSGSDIPKISYVKIKRDDKVMENVEYGAGPLDAAFKAINKMLGIDARLEDFSVRAVTEGEDSIGEAVVKISSAATGEMYTGSGISTDIVEASLSAYLSGINKMFEAGEFLSGR